MRKTLFDLFYFDKDTGNPDIRNYGKYRLGLTNKEVDDYLLVRSMQHPVKKGIKATTLRQLKKQYSEIAGCNTCAVVDGIVLHYRHDVERFADCLFNRKPTYFD